MRNKGKKIKHYKGSFDTGRFKRRRIIRSIVLLIILFVAGYFLAPRILDAGTRLWYEGLKRYEESLNSQSQSTENPPLDESSESEPESTAEPTPEPEPEGDWSVVPTASVATPELAQQTAQQLAQQGAKYAMITLKAPDGTVGYASAVPTASGSLSATPFDAKAIADAMKAEGIVPVAEIWAYRDPAAAYTDRSMAIGYGTREGMLWLDNSAQAGGKPWLNPYSPIARQYIQDLALEAVSLGYEQIVFSGLHFPEVRSTNGANFGDTQGKSFDAILNETIQQLQTALAEQNAVAWFQYSAAAVTGEDLRIAAAPVGGLGMEHLLVQIPADAQDPATVLAACATAAGEKTKAYRVAAAPDEVLQQAAKDNGYKQAVIG